jgi:hypothetical protein
MVRRSRKKAATKTPLTVSFSLNNLSYLLAGALVIVMFYNLATITTATAALDLKLTEFEEVSRPADLIITRLIASNCQDCFDLEQVISVIKRSNVQIVEDKSVDYSSLEGSQLIQQYGITKIPSLIIRGETSKDDAIKMSLNTLGKRNGEVVVFDKQEPPYVNVSTEVIEGLVTATIIQDSNCINCPDLVLALNMFQEVGVKIPTKNTLNLNDPEAITLISRYRIEKVPTIILSRDAALYPNLKTGWAQYGTEESDGNFVMRNTNPPYVNVSSGETVGLVDLILISDSSCTNCYDVMVHKTILPRFGIPISDETELDITNATDLISKYNITKVPTLLISPSTSVYPALNQVWAQVGTIEDDGWYIFRSVQGMGTYKDLSTGQVVEVQQSS